MTELQTIKDHDMMKQILKDSYGGVIYNVANRDKYDTVELLALWDALPAHEKEMADGITTGAINFITS
jgi:hypothetical protein